MSPTVRAAFAKTASPLPQAVEPADDDLDDLRSSLGPLARQSLDNMASRESAPEIDPIVARYHLVECPDGEMSHVTSLKTAESLARRIGDLEGEDMEVWAFYGIPMLLSRGPQRYLSLPDGEHAITIPRGGMPIKTVDITLLTSVKGQEDGYLGPPMLANARVERVPPPKPKKIRQGPLGDDDDDEEDDHDEEAGVDS